MHDGHCSDERCDADRQPDDSGRQCGCGYWGRHFPIGWRTTADPERHVLANFAQSGGGIYASSPITLINVSDQQQRGYQRQRRRSVRGGQRHRHEQRHSKQHRHHQWLWRRHCSTTGNFTGTNVSFIDNAVNNGYDGGGLYASGAVEIDRRAVHQQPDDQAERLRRRRRRDAFGRSDISGTLFSGNTSSDWGGGAYLAYFANSAPSVLTNVQFISNTANGGGGGGLFMWFDSTLNSVDFMSNTASYRGGGAYAGYAGSYMRRLAADSSEQHRQRRRRPVLRWILHAQRPAVFQQHLAQRQRRRRVDSHQQRQRFERLLCLQHRHHGRQQRRTWIRAAMSPSPIRSS